MMARVEINNQLWKALYKSSDEGLKDLMALGIAKDPHTQDDGDVAIEGITDFTEFSYLKAKGLHAIGVQVYDYPLFVSCSPAKLAEDTPDVLPGYQVTEVDDENNEVNTPVTLGDWLAARNHTTQDLTGDAKGFSLPPQVTFAEAVALEAIDGFAVLDQSGYRSLLPIESLE